MKEDTKLSSLWARLWTSDVECEELLKNGNSKYTPKVISMSFKFTQDYLEDKAINISVEDLENEFSFEEILRWAKNEELRIIFETLTYLIRYGLQRHFLKCKGVVIINNQNINPTKWNNVWRRV